MPPSRCLTVRSRRTATPPLNSSVRPVDHTSSNIEIDRPLTHEGYRHFELYDKDGSDEPPISSFVASAISSYPSTIGLQVRVQVEGSTTRPAVHIPATGSHHLAAEQSAGIDNQRYQELLVATGFWGRP